MVTELQSFLRSEEVLIQPTEVKQAHMHLDYPHLLFALS